MTMTDTTTQQVPVQSSVEMISPAEAHKLLSQHPRNRRLSRNRVNSLARAMTAGQWVFDGQPIRIDNQGSLVDGQHRLNALIAADMTLPFLVVRGVPTESMATMDTGKSRSFGDILTIEDPTIVDSNNIAAGTRIIYLYSQGARGRALSSLGSKEALSAAVTPNDLLMFFREHRDEIVPTVLQARNFRAQIAGTTTSAITLVTWVLFSIDEEDARFFFDRLISGTNLEQGNPILALRKRLQDAAIDRDTLPTYETVALFFKAWNAFREGKPMQLLAWKQGGAHPEGFPEPK